VAQIILGGRGFRIVLEMNRNTLAQGEIIAKE
jgi:hypothetical protein